MLLKVCVCIFIFLTTFHECLSGFTSGAPCSVRNTASLQIHGIWHLPKENVQCVDITSIRRKKLLHTSQKIRNATTLYGDQMNLRTIPTHFITTMPHLRLIDFSGNHLRGLAKNSFSFLTKLHTLLLERNHVIIPKKEPLLNSTSLSILSLSSNRIKRLRMNTFKELRGLTVLYLDRNYLAALNPKIFKPLRKLKYLHLGDNRLTSVPHIMLPTQRSILIFKGNPLNRTEIIRK